MTVSPTFYACAIDNGQSAYPLLGFIGLIECEAALGGGLKETRTVKCTRGAAASIALACSESPYEQAVLMLDRLAGFDLTAMTGFRATDSVGAEFVRGAPPEPEPGKIEEMAEKASGNVLKTRVGELNGSAGKDEAIQKAVADGPDGAPRKGYEGPTKKVMYVMGDGTGVPGRRQELEGAKGKQADGSAKTFEAKIGAVFTAFYTEDGRPLLAENGEIYRGKNVKYMGTARRAEDFGPMLYQHAVDNGLEEADAVVFLCDGAKWLRGVQSAYFPHALTCVDLYHSIERVNSMVDFLQFKGRAGPDKKQALKNECIELLRCGKVQEMLGLVESATCKKGSENKLESAMGYFRTNMDRMDYGAFAACGIFVGSGVIEAGCKVIVGNRMKNAGMHWSKDHAEKMIGLRCAVRNGSFLDSYLNGRAANDKLAA